MARKPKMNPDRIARDAVLKFVYSATQSKSDASRVLGVKQAEFSKLLKIYETESYFISEE